MLLARRRRRRRRRATPTASNVNNNNNSNSGRSGSDEVFAAADVVPCAAALIAADDDEGGVGYNSTTSWTCCSLSSYLYSFGFVVTKGVRRQFLFFLGLFCHEGEENIRLEDRKGKQIRGKEVSSGFFSSSSACVSVFCVRARLWVIG